MKLFGAIKELVSAVFRKDSQEVTLRPNQTTTYTAARDIQLPPGDTAHEIVSATSTQTLTNKTFDADGTGNSISNIENADIKAGAAIDAAKVHDGSVSNTEFGYLDGVTSALQTQLDAKIDDFSSTNDNRLLRSDGILGEAVQESLVVVDDLGAVSGVTQLDVDNIRLDSNTISTTAGSMNVDAGANSILAFSDIRMVGGKGLTFQDSDNSQDITVSVPANVTTNRTPEIPDDTGNFTLTSATQTLTNKTINGPSNTITNIANSSTTAVSTNTASAIVARDGSGNFAAGTITAALSGNATTATTAGNVSGTVAIGNGGTGQTAKAAAFDALSPNTTKGDLTGFSTTNARLPAGINGQVLKSDSTQTLGLKWDDAGAGGAGEINAVLNPSATSATTGWAVSGAGSPTVTRLTSGSPLDPITSTALRFGAGSAAAYIYYDFTLPTALLNTKLKIEWNQLAPTTGEWKIEMRTQAGVEYTLSTDSSGDSLIPASAGKFTTTFDSDSTTTLQLRFVRVTGSGNLDVTNVIVGPGIQPQGAVVGAPISWTPTVAGLGAVTLKRAEYSQVGEYIVGDITLTTGTPTAAFASFTLPNSWTNVNSSGGTNPLVGTWLSNNPNATTVKSGGVLVDGASSNFFYLSNYEYTPAVTGTTAALGNSILASSALLTLNFRIRINELVGSGTVNLAQNDVEYASNSGTWNATDTSSFAYGPGGGSITGALTLSRIKRVRFQTPIQATDQFKVQLSEDGDYWTDASNFATAAFNNAVANSFSSVGSFDTGAGAYVAKVAGNSTDVDVTFARYTFIANDDSPVGNWVNGWKWRVVKAKSGQAVGFGLASATSSGLVSSFTGNSTALASGTYTPTITNGTNVAASSAYALNYLVVGKVVSIAGRIDIDPTSTGSTAWTFNTPTGYDISSTAQTCGGSGQGSNGEAVGFFKSTTTSISGRMVATSAANGSIFFTLQYVMD